MNYVKESYELAKKRYAQYGIDTDQVLEALKNIPISMHCWQGDDVIGFEDPNGQLTDGKLSWKGENAGGTQKRYRESLIHDPGETQNQFACDLW